LSFWTETGVSWIVPPCIVAAPTPVAAAGPKVLRDAIPLPPGARWVLVWEHDKQLHEEEIPEPLGVKITGTEL
jgi:hypothetical protein